METSWIRMENCGPVEWFAVRLHSNGWGIVKLSKEAKTKWDH